MNKNLEHLSKNKVTYILDQYEEAAFRFTGTGSGNFCDVKFKGKEPYKVECSTALAMDALLDGKIITEQDYKDF